MIHEKETQNRILDSAIKLFAVKGYSMVSMRDIAKDIGIKASSIYNYYESKDSLLNDVLFRFEKGYKNYFEMLEQMNKNADSLDALMNNMFNSEFLEMLDPIGCLGMSFVMKEQFNSEYAKTIVFNLFHEFSVNSLKSGFDALVQKGIIPPSDTETIARFFMHSVIIMNDIRVHEYTGNATSVDCAEVYQNLKSFIASALTQGVSGK